jgi:hypothetical protein
MPHPQESLDSSWREAFARTLAGPKTASNGLKLFFEARSDLSVEMSSRSGPSSTETLQCGLAAGTGRGQSGDDNWVSLANPSFDDVSRLANVALNPDAAFPAGASGSTQNGTMPAGTSERAVDWLDRLHREVTRLAPTAQMNSRWVQFDQRMLTGAADHPPAVDRRLGCRIRAQVWIEGPHPSAAVSEVILKPAHSGADQPRGPKPEDLARRLVERMRQRTRPISPAPGPSVVVLGPGAGGVLVHEIVGHALEADTALRGSWLTFKEGTVAPSDLTIVDDPRRGRAPWRIDDEGKSPAATCLIARGRVQSWLYDRVTAARAAQPQTGHGRRASYREPVRPRMGCTFIAAGRLRPEEVLEGVDGIYVRRMEAASVDTGSGRATFRVTDGDLLKGGRVQAPLCAHLLRLDAAATLASIDRVADDLTFDTSVGSCQRDGQSIAVSVGAPTIRIGLATVIL